MIIELLNQIESPKFYYGDKYFKENYKISYFYNNRMDEFCKWIDDLNKLQVLFNCDYAGILQIKL